MLVKNWMSRNLIVVDARDSMQQAMHLLKENRIRMLPVMKHGRLVGVVTDRDIKKASPSDATTLDVYELRGLLDKVTVESIMTRTPLTVPADHTIEETAEILLKNRISGVPVIGPGNEVIGVITQTDIFRALISLTGIAVKGIQFAFELEDKPGSIKEVADIIRRYGGRMTSILSSYQDVPEGRRKVYIRMHSIDRDQIRALTDELKRQAKLLYTVDHRDNRREIFE